MRRRIVQNLHWLALCLGCLWPLATLAQTPLRVGTSGDYAPFSTAIEGDGGTTDYEGFDIAVARAYGRARGREIQFVPFRWPRLLRALAEDRFDVAMSGVTVRPERSARGRFSVPVAQTGAVVLAGPKGRFPELSDLDRRPVRIGVNAGGHLQRVSEARFRRATLVTIPDNAAVRAALVEHTIDAAVTDTLEAPSWLAGLEDVDLLGPFTTDRKAYLVHPDRPELAADLDAWLLAAEAEGTLEALRSLHFGDAAGGRLATPLRALLGAMDERLSLMPMVAVAKRRAGLPLEVPEREAVVLDSAVESALSASRKAAVDPPEAIAVRELFRAQMAAAKQVQWSAIKDSDFERPAEVPNLQSELRPALLRLGDHIAQLLIELPGQLDRAAVRELATHELRTPHLNDASRLMLADAITTLANSERTAGRPRRAEGGVP